MKPIIKTEEENKVALAFVGRLMEGDPDPETTEGRLLNLLVIAIQIFEKRYDHPHSKDETYDMKVHAGEPMIDTNRTSHSKDEKLSINTP